MQRNGKFYRGKQLRKLVRRVQDSYKNNYKHDSYYENGYELYIGLSKYGEELLDKDSLLKAIECVHIGQTYRSKYNTEYLGEIKLQDYCSGDINFAGMVLLKDYHLVPWQAKYYMIACYSHGYDYDWKTKEYIPKPVELLGYRLNPKFARYLEVKTRRTKIKCWYPYAMSKNEGELNRKARVTDLWGIATKEMGWNQHNKNRTYRRTVIDKINKKQFKQDINEAMEEMHATE